MYGSRFQPDSTHTPSLYLNSTLDNSRFVDGISDIRKLSQIIRAIIGRKKPDGAESAAVGRPAAAEVPAELAAAAAADLEALDSALPPKCEEDEDLDE